MIKPQGAFYLFINIKVSAKLGGTALWIIALSNVRKVIPELVKIEYLRRFGRFLLFMQKDTGEFWSKYYPYGNKKEEKWKSLYYPGEAILAFVMLYKDNNDTIALDSLPLFVKPYYLSKTDKNGKFTFYALADTSYLIFALNDQNNSLTFDQPLEQIAFIDSLVVPQYVKKVKLDTAYLDTIKGLSADSLNQIVDSLKKIADSLKQFPIKNF